MRKKSILFIDILTRSVYVEYTTRQYEYVSFSDTLEMIRRLKPPAFIYNCVDEPASLALLDSLQHLYAVQGNQMVLREQSDPLSPNYH